MMICMRGRPLCSLAVATLVAFAVTPSAASAANEPWAVTPISPADGSAFTVSPTANGVTVEIRSPNLFPAGTRAEVEFSTETTLGQNGTLADDKRVGYGLAAPRDSDPYQMGGPVSTLAFRYPGTYYVQYNAYVTDYAYDGQVWCPSIVPGGIGNCLFVSPVFSFRVVAPSPTTPPRPPPATSTSTSDWSLSRQTAVNKVRNHVARYLKGRQIKITCRRDDRAMLTCRARYVRKGKVRRKTIGVWRDSTGVHLDL
jgi:hypothetical protein